jgi:uncharacterized membrane protein
MINTPEVYIAISIVVLLAIALIVLFVRKKKEKTHSSLAMLGMTFVVLGIIFISEGRLISYSFMGAGALVSVIDIIRNHKYKLI